MSTKELILQELEQSSARELEQFWAILQHVRKSPDESATAERGDAFWQAYLESEQAYGEVYQRLANS
jgi:hypothetical protein